MDRFQVETETLVVAAGRLTTSGADLGEARGRLSGASGALAGTPAEPAFADFLGSAQLALTSMHDAADALSRALNEAAAAYVIADTSSARSFTSG